MRLRTPCALPYRSDVKLYPLHKMPYGELPLEVEDGVMFCTYQSLIAQVRVRVRVRLGLGLALTRTRTRTRTIAQNKSSERRIDQIIAWAAQSSHGDPEAFEGVLVFDEVGD